VATDDHTVQLDEDTYGVLEAEARRRQVAPDTLVRELVRERFGAGDLSVSERTQDALAELAAVRAKVRAPVDAVALVREGREELERRTGHWLSS
jgi:hypothetical protein